jgi:hydrogenase maturation protease
MEKGFKSDILIVGLGNDILRDDGIGHFVIEELEREIKERDDIELKAVFVSGYYLLDVICEYRWVIIIDAMVTGRYSPGEVIHFKPENLAKDTRYKQSHNVHLPTVLKVGEGLGYIMPEKIDILGIEVKDYMEFGGRDEMSMEVNDAIPVVVRKVLDLIEE